MAKIVVYTEKWAEGRELATESDLERLIKWFAENGIKFRLTIDAEEMTQKQVEEFLKGH